MHLSDCSLLVHVKQLGRSPTRSVSYPLLSSVTTPHSFFLELHVVFKYL